MIQLIKNNRGRAILETTDRYDVMFNGQLYGQLYWNMTGYTGCYLPQPDGIPLHVGERSITEWRREVARANREFKQAKRSQT